MMLQTVTILKKRKNNLHMIETGEIIKLAFKSILRNKVRSFLTALGIIIGVSAVILLVSLGQGLQNYITGQFEQLGSNLIYVLPGKVSAESGFASGGPNFAGSKLTIKMVKEIAKLGGPIKTAAADSDIPATVAYKGKSKYTTVGSISDEWMQIVNVEIEKGRKITRSDVELSRNVALLGKTIAEEFFGSANPIGKEISVGDQKVQVIGIIKEISTQSLGIDMNNFVAIPISTSQRIFGNDSIQTIIIQAVSKDEIVDAKDKAKSYLLTQLKEDEFSVVDQSSLLDTINGILSIVTVALGGIAAISLVVGGVGIMNIMLVSVTERTKEIGLRKAIGAKQKDILMQFIIEAVVLSVAGGLIGITIGWLGSLGFQKFFPAQVTSWSVGLAFGVSAAVGIIFGVAPAIRASRLDPIDALRYE